ncbi:MAG: sulfotransferase [Alcanivoracaceae bacterium]|nr:sulfotransferase [Alcanivoracaceae bacterium]
MQKFKPLYKSLGDLESWLLKTELQDIKVNAPVYITSLARSGTTIITEILSKHDNVCSHTYGDFPAVFTPYWNNWLRQRQPFLSGKKFERAHQDRIMINNDSADAFEEVIWMYFHPQLHQPKIANELPIENDPSFVEYYIKHIKKHLLIKNKSRYIAKANYNISRIKEILKIFPDAKFIIPIRHPVNHIASLMKQHEIYKKAAQNNNKIDSQLAASGHFEFGHLRQVINMGNSQYTKKVLNLWEKNLEIKGWAHYWQGLFEAVIKLKRQSKQLNNAIKFIKYEDLCHHSKETIEDILQYCHLDAAVFSHHISKYEEKLSLPGYYKITFNQDEIDEILQITQTVSRKFGYNKSNCN